MRRLRCIICNSKEIDLIYTSRIPLSITSDLRTWPKNANVFQCQTCGHSFKDAGKISLELAKLYESYKLFESSDAKDQAIFVGPSPKSRSQILVESLSTLANLPENGKFLDIGCNKGVLLKEFGNKYPRWNLYGYEISKDYGTYVKKIKNFKKYYWGEVSRINEQFDLITLIHTLEHIANPVSFLKQIKKLVSPNGLLLIQVPNFRLNPFDIIIYEHISHFYPEILEALLVKSGFEVAAKSLLLVPKELTFICKQKNISYNGQIKANLKFLDRFSKMVMKLKDEKRLVVFGTAEVGTWVGGLLKDNVEFFVDESPWRIGKTHLDKPIKHPKILKRGDNVILAMAPILAKKVKLKWQKSQAKFWYPASLKN